MATSPPPFPLLTLQTRRTYYNLTAKSPISDEEILAIVERAIKYTPSSFNTQTSRAVVVIGDKHRQLWDAVWAAHKSTLPDEASIANFQPKFEEQYKPGYGSVVFFEDQEAMDNFIKMVPAVAGALPVFSQNTAGIAQFIVWTALAAEGLGASLQHYGGFGPVQAAAITKFLGTPESWKCSAIMPFGVPADADAPGLKEFPKTFQPIEERVKFIQ
jgi:predicted oxidoreductase (fatty acid repression mutant protein)